MTADSSVTTVDVTASSESYTTDQPADASVGVATDDATAPATPSTTPKPTRTPCKDTFWVLLPDGTPVKVSPAGRRTAKSHPKVYQADAAGRVTARNLDTLDPNAPMVVCQGRAPTDEEFALATSGEPSDEVTPVTFDASRAKASKARTGLRDALRNAEVAKLDSVCTSGAGAQRVAAEVLGASPATAKAVWQQLADPTSPLSKTATQNQLLALALLGLPSPESCGLATNVTIGHIFDELDSERSAATDAGQVPLRRMWAMSVGDHSAGVRDAASGAYPLDQTVVVCEGVPRLAWFDPDVQPPRGVQRLTPATRPPAPFDFDAVGWNDGTTSRVAVEGVADPLVDELSVELPEHLAQGASDAMVLLEVAARSVPWADPHCDDRAMLDPTGSALAGVLRADRRYVTIPMPAKPPAASLASLPPTTVLDVEYVSDDQVALTAPTPATLLGGFATLVVDDNAPGGPRATEVFVGPPRGPSAVLAAPLEAAKAVKKPTVAEALAAGVPPATAVEFVLPDEGDVANQATNQVARPADVLADDVALTAVGAKLRERARQARSRPADDPERQAVAADVAIVRQAAALVAEVAPAVVTLVSAEAYATLFNPRDVLTVTDALGRPPVYDPNTPVAELVETFGAYRVQVGFPPADASQALADGAHIDDVYDAVVWRCVGDLTASERDVLNDIAQDSPAQLADDLFPVRLVAQPVALNSPADARRVLNAVKWLDKQRHDLWREEKDAERASSAGPRARRYVANPDFDPPTEEVKKHLGAVSSLLSKLNGGSGQSRQRRGPRRASR